GDEPEDNAEEIEVYESNLAIEQNLEKTLRDILSAQKRIEDGTYGVCKYCGKEIDEKRLEERPVSSACISCKSKILKT
ncbi:MAG TPA: TraR/DksA C4-type zinc finger protein, partial [Patescibacteria group bacterium]|nr:TraR/DksA C4-type zinc finger protein [Patescibacteria group bacterium]